MEGVSTTQQQTITHPVEALIEEETSLPLSGSTIIIVSKIIITGSIESTSNIESTSKIESTCNIESTSNIEFRWMSLPFHNHTLPQPGHDSRRCHAYDSLPPEHVRFLARVAQSDPEVLAFKFVSMSLDSAKDKYVAVSYCWGHGTTTDFILADGSFVPASEKVKDHLVYLYSRTASALSGSPEPDKPMIWIDSLCINQADESEKVQQIQLMGRIYHGAITVEIILDSGKASLDVMTDSFLSRSLSGTVDHQFSESLGWLIPPFSKRAIRELMWSPWFSRAWVVQEFCFAKAYRFHYRGILLPHQFLLETCKYGRKNGYIYAYSRDGRFEAIVPPMVQNFHTMLSHRKELQRHLENSERPYIPGVGYGYPLEDVLCSFFDLKTSDPRDKIFAMLNLATGKCPVEANYEQEAPLIYLNTMLSLFRCGTDYALFGFAGLAAQKPLFAGCPDIASWVPDFSTPPTHRTWSDKYKYFNASGISNLGSVKPRPARLIPTTLGDENEELGKSCVPCQHVQWPKYAVGVYGVRLGSIASVTRGDPKRNGAHMPEFLRDARRMIQSLPPDSSTALASNAFSKTLIAENYEYMEQPGSEAGLEEITRILETSDQEESLAGYAEPSLRKAYLDVLLTEGAGRTRGMFRTDNHYIGLAANEVEPGDEVWLLFGARVPFVFRGPVIDVSLSNPVFAYQLVSEAYVHGIMRGELQENWDDAGLIFLI